MTTRFANPLAEAVWSQRYRFAPPNGAPEASIDATWDRVANALAAVEPNDRAHWAARFREALADFRFLPGGRILAGAGTARRVTLFNCFVMGTLDDSLDGIFDALREAALTMQLGGGIGTDFSHAASRRRACRCDRRPCVRAGVVHAPVGSDVRNGHRRRSAPRRDDGHAVLRASGRRAVHRREAAAGQAHALQSLGARDRRIHATRSRTIASGRSRSRASACSAGSAHARCGIGSWRAPTRARSRACCSSTVSASEDNLAYAETISATNPCGEIPLPPYGACDLGSLNLTQFVLAPFTVQARFDLEALAATARVATRMLDNVYSASTFPLPQQAEAARASRRLGLGLTGLADALIMLGLRYDSPDGRAAASTRCERSTRRRTTASIELARERGSVRAFRCASAMSRRRSYPGSRRRCVRRSRATASATAT